MADPPSPAGTWAGNIGILGGMKYALSLALVALAGAAAAEQTAWIADGRTGCKVQNAHPVPNEAVQWTGGCANGYVEGRGALQWYLNGKPNGRTEGEWRAGRLNGRALTLHEDGRRHEGEYKDGQADGRGIITFANGMRLDGLYRNGKANGRGVLTAQNGIRLEGDFVDDAIVRGIQTWPNGNRYAGAFKDYLPDGKGVMTQANGTRYEGDFKAGTWDGQALVNYAVGDVYQGAWRGLYPNGRGTLRGRSGAVSTGTWVEGCLSQANSDNGKWATAGKSAAECGFN